MIMFVKLIQANSIASGLWMLPLPLLLPLIIVGLSFAGGGCCAHTLLSCQPTATETLTFQIMKFEYDGAKFQYRNKELVLVEQHTKCSCLCAVSGVRVVYGGQTAFATSVHIYLLFMGTRIIY